MTVHANAWGASENEGNIKESRTQITLFERLDPSVPEGTPVLPSYVGQ